MTPASSFHLPQRIAGAVASRGLGIFGPPVASATSTGDCSRLRERRLTDPNVTTIFQKTLCVAHPSRHHPSERSESATNQPLRG
jgi:hypothetical protein